MFLLRSVGICLSAELFSQLFTNLRQILEKGFTEVTTVISL